MVKHKQDILVPRKKRQISWLRGNLNKTQQISDHQLIIIGRILRKILFTNFISSFNVVRVYVFESVLNCRFSFGAFLILNNAEGQFRPLKLQVQENYHLVNIVFFLIKRP